MISLNIEYENENVGIGFPCEESELERALKYLKIPSSFPPKVYVKKVLEPRDLSVLTGKELNLDEVNYLAKLMEGLWFEEFDTLYAIAAYKGYDEPKALINQIFNLNCYTLIRDIGHMSRVGRDHLLRIKGELTPEEEEKTDFAKISRELLESGKGVWTDYGLLFRNEEIPFEEVYDGQVFPPYDYNGKKWLLRVEIGYGEKTESVYLPTEPLAITKSVLRLGAPSPESCRYVLEKMNIGDEEWEARFDAFLKSENIFNNSENIFNINKLLLNVGLCKAEVEKFRALIDYVEDKTLSTLLKLSERMDEFLYFPYVNDYESVGQNIRKYFYEIGEKMEEGSDYEDIGKRYERNNHGRFVNNGFVCTVKSETLEEILWRDAGQKLGGL